MDHHNNLGTFFTPRLHFRFVPIENFILRVSGGNGRKAANIFAENQTLFATARKINIQSNEGSIYGLNPIDDWQSIEFNLKDDEISKLEIPTGNPLLINLDETRKITDCKYLDSERANDLVVF